MATHITPLHFSTTIKSTTAWLGNKLKLFRNNLPSLFPFDTQPVVLFFIFTGAIPRKGGGENSCPLISAFLTTTFQRVLSCSLPTSLRLRLPISTYTFCCFFQRARENENMLVIFWEEEMKEPLKKTNPFCFFPYLVTRCFYYYILSPYNFIPLSVLYHVYIHPHFFYYDHHREEKKGRKLFLLLTQKTSSFLNFAPAILFSFLFLYSREK